MSRTRNYKINEKTKNKKSGSKSTNTNTNTNVNVNVNGVPQKNAHYFQHNGYYGTNPNKIKKNGGGKGNWGTITSELDASIDDLNDDYELDDDATGSQVGNSNNRRGSNKDPKAKHSTILYNKSSRRNSNHRLDEERLYDLERYQV